MSQNVLDEDGILWNPRFALLSDRELIHHVVLQEAVADSTTHAITETTETPPTITIPEDLLWLTRFSREQLFLEARDPEKSFSLLNPTLVKKWGLREGDIVTYNASGKIVGVNGCSDPEVLVNRVRIDAYNAPEPDYPQRLLPVIKFNSYDLWVSELLAPTGYGSMKLIAAPPNTGKSVITRGYAEALTQLTNCNPNLIVIGFHVGERGKDATKLRRALMSHPHDGSRVRFYSVSDKPTASIQRAHWETAQVVYSMARRFVEMGNTDVVVVGDSVARIMLSHTRSTDVLKAPNSGLLANAVNPGSVEAVRQLVAGTGFYDLLNSTFTTISTVLASDGETRSGEVAFWEETGSSSSDSTLVLMDMPPARYPKLHVTKTKTREENDMLQYAPELKALIESVRQNMWYAEAGTKGGRVSVQAFEALQFVQATVDNMLTLGGSGYGKVFSEVAKMS